MYVDLAHLISLRVFRNPNDAAEKMKRFGVNRNKLQQVVKCDSPGLRNVGRPKTLSDGQMRDLAVHVRVCEQGNRPLTVTDAKKCIWRFWMINEGLVTSTCPIDWDVFEEYEQKMDKPYRTWMDWVNEHVEDDALKLAVKHLKGCKSSEAASCTPAVVADAITKLEKLCEETCISQNGVIIGADRIWYCDEKGFDEGEVKMQKGVCTKGNKQPTKAVGDGRMRHITVAPFVSLAGKCHPRIGAVVKGKQWHPDFEKKWGNRFVDAQENACMTPSYFAELLEDWAVEVRKEVPLSKALALVVDSGGGALLHLSTEILLVAEKHNVRVFFLPPNTTTILMSLDWAPNRQAEKEWHKIRGKEAPAGDLTVWRGLDIIKEVCSFSYIKAFILIGFKSVGLVQGKPIDRELLLVKRKQDGYYKKILANCEISYETPEAKILEKPTGYKKRSVQCKCTEKISFGDKYCRGCGEQNAQYDEVQGAVQRVGARTGWCAERPGKRDFANLTEELGVEKATEIAKFSGDLKAEMSKRGSNQSSGKAAAEQKPLQEKPKIVAEAKSACTPEKLPPKRWCLKELGQDHLTGGTEKHIANRVEVIRRLVALGDPLPEDLASKFEEFLSWYPKHMGERYKTKVGHYFVNGELKTVKNQLDKGCKRAAIRWLRGELKHMPEADFYI